MKKRFRTMARSVVGVAAAGVLAAAVDAAGQPSEVIPFDLPAVHVVGFTEQYDVTAELAPHLVPMNVVSAGAAGGAKTAAQATANINDARGFRAAASTISPTYAEAANPGRSRVAMDFSTHDPVGRDRVKVVLEFTALANAGAPVIRDLYEPYGPASQSHFGIEVGWEEQGGTITRYPGGGWTFAMPKIRLPQLLVVYGNHWKRRLRDGSVEERSGLTIYGNGQVIETTPPASSPLTVNRKKVTMTVPAETVNVIKINADVEYNAFAYVDPVVTPHPDNPEVVVTLNGAVDPTPPPLVTFSPEELTAAGIDVAPMAALGLLDPPTASAITFLAPAPDAACRLGKRVKVQLRLADAAGAPIPDVIGKSLSRACRVLVGLDAATRCARYNAKRDAFLVSVQVPKTTVVGSHRVVAQVLGEDDAVADGAATAVTIQ